MQVAIEEQAVREIQTVVASSNVDLKTPEELLHIVSEFAATDGWIERVRLNTKQRWYERVHEGLDYDIWVISWMPGQSTGFHDHGESAGAFVVATGVLEEHRPGERPVVITSDKSRAFEVDYAHDVRNASNAPAISIHAYSPPLSEMNEYELEGERLVPRDGASERVEALREEQRESAGKALAVNVDVKSIDDVLAAARTQLQRLSPREAYEVASIAEAVLVDIRPERQRTQEGSIPGALVVERNVLEWRFDPLSSARLPVATDHDVQVIVFCSEGYTSSLAAAALQELGLWRATDIVGGFQAWRSAKLPILPPLLRPT